MIPNEFLHDSQEVIARGTRMFTNGIRSLTVMICLGSGVTSVQAMPISYEFSGTLTQPYDGSSQFSGTLTYNTSLQPHLGIPSSPGWSTYSGVPTDPSSPVVSLSFTLGNTPSSSLGSITVEQVIVGHTQANDGFYVEVQYAGPYLLADFGMVNNNLVQPAPLSSTSPPSSLNLGDFSMFAQLNVWGRLPDGQQIDVAGDVTSLMSITSVPEPGPHLILLVMIAGFFSCRRHSATGRPCAC